MLELRSFGSSRLGVEVEPRDDLDTDDHRNDPVHGRTERRPPSGSRDELTSLLPRILDPMGREPEGEQPCRTGDAGGGDDDEAHRDNALDDDDSRSPVCYSEADVDRRDQGESEGID